MTRTPLVFDVEIFRNYLLVGFMNVETGNVRQFEAYEGKDLEVDTVRAILRKYLLVSFNGSHFDLPVLAHAMAGFTIAQVKKIASAIIQNNVRFWQHGVEMPVVDHVDLIEVAPGVRTSLKAYGGRMHCQRLQELPIEHDAAIDPDDRELLRRYNVNDLVTTAELWRTLAPQIALREELGRQYGLDLRSKSDAQIAETVIRSEVEKRMGERIERQEYDALAGHTFRFDPPAWFATDYPPLAEAFERVCSTVFQVAGNGTIQMPKELSQLAIPIGEGRYRMGIGGLHSSEKSVSHFSDDHHVLIDRDVASYYPSIILSAGMAPAQMGHHFTRVYRQIVERRLAAKRAGDKVTADTLKIVINGSFGKFGSPYSVLYDPKLLIQTTLTGQLALLMLIDMLETQGIPVVSANTDGLVMRCPRDRLDTAELVIGVWESLTDFETEATEYRALYSRDVNNYVAIKTDGSLKLKGAFAPTGLMKHPTGEISTTAAIRYLLDGTRIRDTVLACRDISKFIHMRAVTGGAVKDGVPLGRLVRWYYRRGERGEIRYRLNDRVVANTFGAWPVMDLPDEFPDDIDYANYILEGVAIIRDFGLEYPHDDLQELEHA